MARPCTYKVFLSFRGEDTRKGFTSHLYTALVNRGITTYIDDKNLRKGDLISDELLTAIEESMFGVIVLSPNYASSTWCLDELHKIVECNNNLGLQIVAVFYHVKPCDVRHQIGAFEEAFKKHELRFGKEGGRVRRWRNALTQVVSYSNWDSERFENEAILVESITQHIHERLIMKLPSSMKNLVGIDSRLEEVVRHIGLGGNDVRFIGICGMGGIGKTTIARRVYETIRSEFKVSCFLADVRERSEKRGIVQLQKQLLDCMNINSDTRFDDEFEGKGIICHSLCHKKVLLVLDDVDDGGLLENLAGEQDWFGPGSRIIITTRDTHVLEVHGAAYRICKVEGLEQDEALELFCLRAFKRSKPEEGYMDLSQEVVKYCDGLPLALVVLGSHLCGQTIDVWRSAIEKIKSFPHDKIFNTLKISYDGLDHSEKNIFLDIACFFKGREKDYATNIWKRCGYHVEASIAALINKSLLAIGEYYKETLEMHDLLEDMGKYIVIKECRDDPSKQSRLWSYKDVDLVLAQNKEIEATHSIVLYNKMEWGFKGKQRVLDIRDLSFSNMCKLKILILDNVKGPILCNIPCTLKVLHWRRCPMKTLPFTDQSYELVDIDLSYSKIVQLWDGKKVLKKLEHLNLSNCHKLKQTPELCGAPNLKTLDLSECKALNYIHPFLAHHKSLVELNLYGCSRLRRLPEFGEGMKQLSVLILTDTGIEELPEELPTTPGKFAGVSKLDLSGCDKLTSLPLSLGCFVGLKELVLSIFMELSCVPYSTHGLESLTVEDYSDSPNIVGLLCSLSCFTSLSTLKLHVCFGTLSYNLGHLASLTDLDLSDNDFCQLPISILELPRLTRLQLYHCRFLEVLPEIPSSLRVLQADRCCSLVASKVYDAISKACCVFAESASQDREDFLQMLMPELYQEMPAWFEDQEEHNGVSLSSPSTEIIALALCFLLDGDEYSEEQPSVICNGKEFINTRLLKVSMSSYYKTLLILCLNGYSFSNLLCQDNRFQLQFPSDCCEIRVKRSGARWVCKQDIQLLKKRKYERGKRKANLELNMDMISHSSASRNKMAVVDSPVYEQEVSQYITCMIANLRSL
ncbi:TMV resistance protein N-like isoform X2 [Arachis stenosperma]|uniref:TMV resistance protein N-like isoform X2 n=1 Tax=Arachis stenosperma TaxID=217475 RepID=UPI0025AB9605|nr:TMV resistance protein N-like isoform X2 [Arachis stenosperma]